MRKERTRQPPRRAAPRRARVMAKVQMSWGAKRSYAHRTLPVSVHRKNTGEREPSSTFCSPPIKWSKCYPLDPSLVRYLPRG